jgi:hypothetical protein
VTVTVTATMIVTVTVTVTVTVDQACLITQKNLRQGHSRCYKLMGYAFCAFYAFYAWWLPGCDAEANLMWRFSETMWA